MEQIKFELPVFNTFNAEPLRIEEQFIPISFELATGEHTTTSVPIKIGTFLGFEVFGHLSITYSYDPDMKYITIAGLDSTSEKQLSIHLSIEKHPELTCKQQLDRVRNKSLTSNMLTDFIEKTPKVKTYFQTIIHQTIDNLVKYLLNEGIQGVIQTGTAPIVNTHNYRAYRAMFLPKEAALEATLDNIIAVQQTVDSTYGGTITWSLNTPFANVIGSTDDPKPPGYNSWIQLWADKCNGGYRTDRCSSYNYADGKSGFDCNKIDFVGGHVIRGTVAKVVPKGSTVYIYPICKRHNGNDNIYMSSRYNPTGVVLKNYMY